MENLIIFDLRLVKTNLRVNKSSLKITSRRISIALTEESYMRVC